VCSPTPKFSPETVSEADPLSGALSGTLESTDASKLNVPATVPAKPPTVTDVVTSFGRAVSTIAEGAQLTDVVEIQLDVSHGALDSVIECVCSIAPKFRPRTVTDAWPLCGVLSPAPVTPGASKLNTWNCVPTTDPTVRANDWPSRSENWLPISPLKGSAAHTTLVEVVHEVESHSKCVYVFR
jgi:hypothetical protein